MLKFKREIHKIEYLKYNKKEKIDNDELDDDDNMIMILIINVNIIIMSKCKYSC